jgi:gliding motility-associated-like protein
MHASNVSTSDVYCHFFTLNWTNGNGERRLVLAKEGTAVDATPADLNAYIANQEFKQGSQVGTGNFTIYNGSGNSVKMIGLKKNTTYHLAIFEYNITSSGNEYYTESSYAKISQKTENITPDFSVDDSYQCFDGNSFTFTNSSTNTKSQAMTYSWDMGDKSPKRNTTDVTYSYATGGLFDVKLTATYMVGAEIGCSATYSFRDTVLVPFITDFDLRSGVMGNDSVQCFVGNEYDIENLEKVPPITYGTVDRTKYKWTATQGSGTPVIVGTGQHFKFNAATWGNVTVKIVQARSVSNGSNVLFCSDSFEKVYHILPPPIFDTDVEFKDTLLCLNEKDFEFEHQGRDVVFTNWDFGDGTSSNDNPAAKMYSAVGKYEVTLFVRDSYDCIADYADSVEVVTVPNNSFTGLDPKYCFGDPVVDLVPSIDGGQFSGGNVDPNARTFSPNSVGQFTVYHVYTQGNCKDTFSASTEVFPTPVFSIGPDTVICNNSTITLEGDDPSLTYSWSTGGIGPSITVTSGGTYWAEGTNGECSSRDTLVIRTITPPTIDLGLDTTICGGQSIEYKLFSDAGSILWSDGSTEFNRKITESGYYQVTITHPCLTVTDDITVEILPFACEIFIPNAFSPNNDGINDFFYPLGFFEYTDMIIFNEYGEKLFESNVEGLGWDGTFNGVPCHSGIYYYQLRYLVPIEGFFTKQLASGSLFLMR